MSLYSSNFQKIFGNLLTRTGISCYQITKYTDLDGAYLSRLRNGGKNNPSAETVMKISLALTHFSPNVDLNDIEELFRAVGRSINLR